MNFSEVFMKELAAQRGTQNSIEPVNGPLNGYALHSESHILPTVEHGYLDEAQERERKVPVTGLNPISQYFRKMI